MVWEWSGFKGLEWEEIEAFGLGGGGGCGLGFWEAGVEDLKSHFLHCADVLWVPASYK